MAGASPESKKERRPSPRSPGSIINFKMAGISLMLAILFWLLFTLRSQHFITTISYPVALRNLPPGTELAVALPERIKVTVEATGNKIFLERYKFFDDTIFIDYRRWSGLQYFTLLGQSQPLNGNNSRGIRVLSTFPDTIPLRFVRRFTKKVPVQPVFDFRASGTIRVPLTPTLFPDSVLLQGDEQVIRKIPFCSTSPLTIPAHPGPFRIYAKIICPSEVKATPGEVEVNAVAEAYTEKRLELVPEMKNLPAGYSVRTDPQKITAYILVPEKEFAKVNASNVKAVLDFSAAKEGTRFLVPRIESANAGWETGRIEPATVNFILTRK